MTSHHQLPDYILHMMDNIVLVADETLPTLKTSEDVNQLCQGIYGFCQAVLDERLADAPPPDLIACNRGCAACCGNATIEALPIEILAVAHHLDETGARKATQAKLADNIAQNSTMCPLLDSQGACAVHHDRLFVCRGFNAYDQTACERKKRHGEDIKIMGYAHQGWIYQAGLTALHQACRLRGLDYRPVDFPSALALALQDVKACTRRWLTGGDIFAACRASGPGVSQHE